jgi:hypothetical protein
MRSSFHFKNVIAVCLLLLWGLSGCAVQEGSEEPLGDTSSSEEMDVATAEQALDPHVTPTFPRELPR